MPLNAPASAVILTVSSEPPSQTCGYFSSSWRVDREGVRVLEDALAASARRDGKARACLLANLSTELVHGGDWERRVALSDEALAMARRVGDPTTLAHVLSARCTAIWAPPTAVERLANTGDLVAMSDISINGGVINAYEAAKIASTLDPSNKGGAAPKKSPKPTMKNKKG
jgi:hypothetical protein